MLEMIAEPIKEEDFEEDEEPVVNSETENEIEPYLDPDT